MTTKEKDTLDINNFVMYDPFIDVDEEYIIDTQVSDEIKAIQTTLVEDALLEFSKQQYDEASLKIFVLNLLSWRVPSDSVLAHINQVKPELLDRTKELIEGSKGLVPRLPTK